MEKFQDFQHYQMVIENFNKSHENLVGNVTTLKREIESVISEGRLFYNVYPHTLIIFRDELDFWQVMLLTDGQTEDISLPEGKPYASLISNALKKGNTKETLHEKITSMGISLVGVYSSYKTDLSIAYPIAKSIVDDWTEEIERKGYKFLPFQKKYIDIIHKFWNQNLERYHFPKEQWHFEYDVDNVLLLFDLNFSVPKLVATVFFLKKDSSYISSGLAVDSEYRHDMLGLYIDAVEFCMAYEKGIKNMYSWILDDNIKAIKLGELFGAKKLPLKSSQYYSFEAKLLV